MNVKIKYVPFMMWNTVVFPRRLKINMITTRCSKFLDLQMSRHHAYIPHVLINKFKRG